VAFSEGYLLQGKPEIRDIPQRTSPSYCGPNGPADPCDSIFSWRKFYTRDSICKAPKSKEWLQVLKEARFALEVGFQNLREWELGLLVLSLGIAPGYEFNWKLGGAKNRGMGLIQVTLSEGNPSCNVYAQGKNWFFKRTSTVNKEFLKQVTQVYLNQLDKQVRSQVEDNLKKLREEYGYG